MTTDEAAPYAAGGTVTGEVLAGPQLLLDDETLIVLDERALLWRQVPGRGTS